MPAVTPKKIDAWDTDKSNWQYLSIPKENALGESHATMELNLHRFDAGNTYFVPKEVADTVNERLAVYARSCVRILQPRRDYAAENAVAIGSANSRQSGAGQAVDPSVVTSQAA